MIIIFVVNGIEKKKMFAHFIAKVLVCLQNLKITLMKKNFFNFILLLQINNQIAKKR